MADTNTLATVEQGDVAALESGGVYYRCYTWVDREAERIAYAIYTEQEHGQQVLVLTGTITAVVFKEADASATGVTSPSRIRPKVIAHGTKFVCVYFETTAAGVHRLKKYYIDAATINSVAVWSASGTLDVHSDGLFDLAPIVGSGNGNYVVAWKDAGTFVTVAKYTDTTWTATWTTQVGGQTPLHCVGVYGHLADGVVLVSYDRTNGAVEQLWTARMTEGAGASGASAATFTSAPMDDATFSVVGHARISATVVAVVAEFRPVAFAAVTAKAKTRGVCYVYVLIGSAAPTGNQHYTYNLSMHSRPFAYASHNLDGSSPSLYVCVGFRTTADGLSVPSVHGWEQANFYVVNLDHVDWGAWGTGLVRARQVSTMNLGTADSRNHGLDPGTDTDIVVHKSNHLSHVVKGFTLGQLHKGHTFVVPAWTRLVPMFSGSTNEIERTELIPSGAAVRAYTFLPEEPWLVSRDAGDPAAPSANWGMSYQWQNFQTAKAGLAVMISGGTPALYDGRQIAEVGFAWWPEITGNTTVGGNVEIGGYYYTAVYEWRDHLGQLHRSAPSRPKLLTVVSTAKAVTLTVRTITLTTKHSVAFSGSSPIDIVLYRTKKNDTTFRRVYGYAGGAWAGGGFAAEPSNDPTAITITILDNRPDSELQYQDILPFQLDGAGNWTPVENVQPPAATAICNWQNRVWVAAAEDPRMLWYSAELLPEGGGTQYEAPRFNAVNTYRVDEGDPIVAIQPMDHLLIVFTRGSVYALAGQPNDDTGSGSTLAHQWLPGGMGCVSPRSVVLGPDGVFFQGERGIFLLTRSLELVYVGAQAEDSISRGGIVKSATMIEDRHQIRFVLNEGVSSLYRVLIYDHAMRQWSTAVMPQADSVAARAALVGGCSWRGAANESLHVALAGTQILIERPNVAATAYKDQDYSGDVPIGVLVETGWVSLAGIVGFKRVRQLALQLEKPQSSGVEVEADYLYGSTSINETVRWDSPAPPVLRIRPREQKMQAFRLTLTEVDTVPQTENIKILALSVEVGVKRGPLRVADAGTYISGG